MFQFQRKLQRVALVALAFSSFVVHGKVSWDRTAAGQDPAKETAGNTEPGAKDLPSPINKDWPVISVVVSQSETMVTHEAKALNDKPVILAYFPDPAPTTTTSPVSGAAAAVAPGAASAMTLTGAVPASVPSPAAASVTTAAPALAAAPAPAPAVSPAPAPAGNAPAAGQASSAKAAPDPAGDLLKLVTTIAGTIVVNEILNDGTLKPLETEIRVSIPNSKDGSIKLQVSAKTKGDNKKQLTYKVPKGGWTGVSYQVVEVPQKATGAEKKGGAPDPTKTPTSNLKIQRIVTVQNLSGGQWPGDILITLQRTNQGIPQVVGSYPLQNNLESGGLISAIRLGGPQPVTLELVSKCRVDQLSDSGSPITSELAISANAKAANPWPKDDFAEKGQIMVADDLSKRYGDFAEPLKPFSATGKLPAPGELIGTFAKSGKVLKVTKGDSRSWVRAISQSVVSATQFDRLDVGLDKNSSFESVVLTSEQSAIALSSSAMLEELILRKGLTAQLVRWSNQRLQFNIPVGVKKEKSDAVIAQSKLIAYALKCDGPQVADAVRRLQRAIDTLSTLPQLMTARDTADKNYREQCREFFPHAFNANIAADARDSALATAKKSRDDAQASLDKLVSQYNEKIASIDLTANANLYTANDVISSLSPPLKKQAKADSAAESQAFASKASPNPATVDPCDVPGTSLLPTEPDEEVTPPPEPSCDTKQINPEAGQAPELKPAVRQEPEAESEPRPEHPANPQDTSAASQGNSGPIVHVLLVCDPAVASSKDKKPQSGPSAGKPVANNANPMVKFFNDVKTDPDVGPSFKVTTFPSNDGDATPEAIRKFYKNLNSKPGHKLVFYFSGHGGGGLDSHSLWMTKGSHSLARSELRQLVNACSDNGRIILTDCCSVDHTYNPHTANQEDEMARNLLRSAGLLKDRDLETLTQTAFNCHGSTPKKGQHSEPEKLDPGMLRKLFVDFEGTVDITSASPTRGQYGFGTYFSDSLAKELRVNGSDWPRVFTNTQERTSALSLDREDPPTGKELLSPHGTSSQVWRDALKRVWQFPYAFKIETSD